MCRVEGVLPRWVASGTARCRGGWRALSALAGGVDADVWAGIEPALREGALVHRDKRVNRFHTKGLNN